MDLAYAETEDAETVADSAEQRIYDVARRDDREDVAVLRDLVSDAMADLESIQNRDSAYTGVPTGFVDLDNLMSGLQPGNLIVVAARPGIGKSSLAMNIARNIAVDRQPVAMFSLEMSRMEIGMRLLCAEARVPWDRIRNKRVGPDDWQRVVHAAEVLHDAPLSIVDSGNVNIVDIRAKARRMRSSSEGLSLIIVDYLQLMTSPSVRRPDNRQQEVAEISRNSSCWPRSSRCPVMALSQLNRNPEARADKRPQLSDLRESGRDRAGQRRRHVHPSRRHRPREEEAGRAHRGEAPQRAHRHDPAHLRTLAHAVPERGPRPGRVSPARPRPRIDGRRMGPTHAPAHPSDLQPARQAFR